MFSCKTASASGHLPKTPLAASPSPLSASPAIPSPLRVRMPPRRYFGQSTSRTFSHTAFKSRDKVSQTDSSIVFVGARRSSPEIADVKYDWLFGPLEDDDRDCILPVKGVRSLAAGCSGSSKSSRSATKWCECRSIQAAQELTIIWIYHIIWIIRSRRRGCHSYDVGIVNCGV